MGIFERFLSLWVLLCIGIGVSVGSIFKDSIRVLSEFQIANVNIPIAVLVWAMIFPMMVQINFSSIKDVGKGPKGICLTIIINWLIKPFSMAFFAWVFFENIYSSFLTPELAKEYIAGAILLGAAPCTAMVFVWSYLTDGDPEYTLIQVAINDLILLFAFIPIVKLLLGVSHILIPYKTLFTSVFIFIVIPLIAGLLINKLVVSKKGLKYFEEKFLPMLKPFSITSLLTTLILLFAFQGERIINHPWHIVLISLPLIIQTYLLFFLCWYMGKKASLSHCILSPSAMIGASNFFELAVAVAIALFGLDSGAALVTVVGVLIEVPVMLSLVRISNRWKF